MGRISDLLLSLFTNMVAGHKEPHSLLADIPPESLLVDISDQVTIKTDGSPNSKIVHAIAVPVVKDVWIGIHNNRLVTTTGRIKENSRGIDIAFPGMNHGILDDGTASIQIEWSNFLLRSNSDTVYRVTGTCRTKDGVRAYLENCGLEVISEPHAASLVLERKAHTLRRERETTFDKQLPDSAVVYEKAPEAGYGKTTGANWTKDFSGTALDTDSNWQHLRAKVFTRDGHACVQCDSNENLTVDHIQPLSLGGENKMSNLQTLCSDCHEDKHYVKFFDRAFTSNSNYGKNYQLTGKVKIIADAVRCNGRVSITYTDRLSKTTSRTIQPKRIYKGYRHMDKTVCTNCIYVDAYCELDRDKRTFRLSRMKDPRTVV